MSFKQLNKLNAKIIEESKIVNAILSEVGKVVIGQKEMIERLIIGILADGHVLLEGVPGIAKTTTIRSLAETIAATFKRIQFTPDLLPADLIGTLVYNQHKGEFYVKKGPIFANIILADEINRAPAKVQSALLEAMEEDQVTIGDRTYKLEEPFLVLATQNPIDQEGTYSLPEAQMDRFMFKLKIDYPNRSEELGILRRMTGEKPEEIKQTIEPENLIRLRSVVRKIYMDEKIENYIVDLVSATRLPNLFNLNNLNNLIEYGASPRATIFWAMAAKAHAFLNHRGYVTPEDVHAVGFDILRHRVIISYEAEAENITSEDLIKQIFSGVKTP